MTGEQSSVNVPPGWYRDPYGEAASRWWDGRAWTGYVATPPEAPPSRPAAPRRPKRHLILTHARSAVLFGLTIITAAIALGLLYPWGAKPDSAHASTNIEEIDIYLAPQTSGESSTSAVSSATADRLRVGVIMKSDGNGGTKMQFWVPGAKSTIDSAVVWMPHSTWADASDCESGQPSGVTCAASDDKTEMSVTYDTPDESKWIELPKSDGAGWGANSSEEYVSVVIPVVGVYQNGDDDSADKPEVDAIAYMSYNLPLKDDYTWMSGSAPEGPASGQPMWPIQTSASWSPVAEYGTSLVVQDEVERNIFLAGAVVGVSAAAFAAAIAELVGTSATESKWRRRREAAEQEAADAADAVKG